MSLTNELWHPVFSLRAVSPVLRRLAPGTNEKRRNNHRAQSIRHLPSVNSDTPISISSIGRLRIRGVNGETGRVIRIRPEPVITIKREVIEETARSYRRKEVGNATAPLALRGRGAAGQVRLDMRTGLSILVASE